ncbi:MAG: VWA domain-containing protein [Acidobacteriota bacterium]
MSDRDHPTGHPGACFRLLLAAWIAGSALAAGGTRPDPAPDTRTETVPEALLDLPAQVRFEAPAPGRVVFGPTRVEVSVLPSRIPVERVQFFLDGKLRGEDRHPPYTFDWNAGYEFLSHRLEAVADLPGREPVRTSMQTARVAVRELIEVQAEPHDLVEINFVVTNAAGDPVRNLGRQNFRLEVDGKATRIETLVEERRRRPRRAGAGPLPEPGSVAPGRNAGGRRPLSIALLLDVSRSMRRLNRERFLLATQALLDKLRPHDEMMIMSFDSDYEVRSDFTSDPRELREALESVPPPDRGTNLYGALEEALERLEKRRGRRVIILYSDGQATLGRSSLTATPASLDVLDKTNRQPITLYWVVPHFQDATIVQRTPALRRLAIGSGGRWILETEGIEKVLGEIGRELSSQYFASFYVDKTEHRRPFYDIDLKPVNSAYRVQAPTVVAGSGSLVQRLEEMLDSKDEDERLAAAVQLPRYGYSKAYLALRQRYSREKDAGVRDTVLAALLVILRDEWNEIVRNPDKPDKASLRHIERQIRKLDDPRALALLETLHRRRELAASPPSSGGS